LKRLLNERTPLTSSHAQTKTSSVRERIVHDSYHQHRSVLADCSKQLVQQHKNSLK